ncbi:hypothetical protein [Vibrio sp. TRT 1302]|uniref:hypothetical protein n=1 Tax=Vibrio sp. TRT 1302 TaxID=3418504 RepID=UPI003CEE5EE8
MKLAYHYDYESHAFTGTSQIQKVAGYDEYIVPQFATWNTTPEFDEETEQAKFDVKNQKWFVEFKPVVVTGYHKQTHQLKVFDDASLVTDEYTLEKPSTRWDEWTNGAWVTNLRKIYISDYAQVDATRESLYRAQTDPLENEARRLERSGATAQELQVYYDRIDDLVAKIKADNPWPVNPEV